MSEEERLVGAAAARGDEDETDRSLRPRQLDEFVGQEVVREQLSIALAAARERGEPIDHVLLAGPPGLGKSTLAHIVATEMDTRLITVSGPGLDRKGDLVAILADLADPTWCSSTRCTASTARSKRRSTRPWRTASSTSSWARARAPAACGWTSRRSP